MFAGAGGTKHVIEQPPAVAAVLAAAGYDVLGHESRPVSVDRFVAGRDESTWEHFLAGSSNGNLFQSRRFLAYHPAGRFEDHSLLFRRHGELLAVAAGEAANHTWSAHRFSSHGGIAVMPGTSPSDALEIVHSLLTYARANGWSRLTMRFVPDAIAEETFLPVVWALSVLGFTQDSREMTWCLLPRFNSAEELLAAYEDGARRAVHKARKQGLLARESTDYGAFWDILADNLKQRHGVAPTHSIEEITRIRSLCPGEVQLHAVHDSAGQMLAGSVVFDVSAHCSHCFYFGQDYSFQSVRPMPLLMHHLNLEYAVKRKRRLNYGVFTAAGGTELNLGLSRFKESFATVPSIRRRFTWESTR